jgi:hypothetical protein
MKRREGSITLGEAREYRNALTEETRPCVVAQAESSPCYCDEESGKQLFLYGNLISRSLCHDIDRHPPRGHIERGQAFVRNVFAGLPGNGDPNFSFPGYDDAREWERKRNGKNDGALKTRPKGLCHQLIPACITIWSFRPKTGCP